MKPPLMKYLTDLLPPVTDRLCWCIGAMLKMLEVQSVSS